MASSPRPTRTTPPSADEIEQRQLGGALVDGVRARGHDRRDLLRREALGERGERLGRRLAARRGARSSGSRFAISTSYVWTGWKPPAISGRRRARRSGRAPCSAPPPSVMAVVPCFSAACRRRARLGALRLVGLVDLGAVEQVEDRRGRDPGRGPDDGADARVVVEDQGRRELGELQGAQRLPARTGSCQAGRDDRAAGPCRGRRARLRLVCERHAELAEHVGQDSGMRSGVKPLSIFRSAFSLRPIMTRRQSSCEP